jgi:hypothetical protein
VVCFGQPTVSLCVLTAALGLLAYAYCLLPVLLWRDVIVWHMASFVSIAHALTNRGFNLSLLP